MRTWLLCFLSTLFAISGFVGNEAVAQIILFDWDEPQAVGTHWPGWQWYSGGDGNGADNFGSPGWRKEDGKFMSGCCNWMPRSQDKGNDDRHGGKCLAMIEDGALKVYDVTNDDVNRASWWVYIGGDNLGRTHGLDSTINRMDFYLKGQGISALNPQEPNNSRFTVGTYLCWPDGGFGGDSCPKEADNQHYYHYLYINPDAWIHVVLDRHPQHQRGAGIKPDNNPYIEFQRHYYPSLNAMYFEFWRSEENLTSYYLDDIEFYSTSDKYEPTQNDISISSVWVGYWPEKDAWEMGFCDTSFGPTGYSNASGSTFEIRYSTEPITNDNFELASPIKPMFHAVEENTGAIRRFNNWIINAWTRFTLPDELEENHDKIYFGIRDISSEGAHKGVWPHQLGDGHDAPNDLIHTIDYHIRGRDGHPTAVGANPDPIPEQIQLFQNYPNPFNPSTIIEFSVLETTKVSLKIHNTLGQVVRTLVGDKVLSPSFKRIAWDGRDDLGKLVSNGVYLYRLETSSQVFSRKMLLLK